MFLQGILKITLRNFRNNLITTLIKILGLAVSITAVIIIWSFVINENRYDSGIPGTDNIYRLEAQWASMPPFIGHVIGQNLTDQVVQQNKLDRCRGTGRKWSIQSAGPCFCRQYFFYCYPDGIPGRRS